MLPLSFAEPLVPQSIAKITAGTRSAAIFQSWGSSWGKR